MKKMIVLLVLILSLHVNADYEIRSHTVNGGGGVSSGGAYIVRGTITQEDAAVPASDDYDVLGGFWPGEPSCFVDLEHFAKFAQYWLQTGDDLPADLYKDAGNIVDELDLNELMDYWLLYCPYDWPLK